MNEIVSSQALLFITSIEIGIILGMLFDIIRVTRKIVKIPDLLVQIEDVLYWIVSGLVGFYILYITNYAAIRHLYLWV
ncbi:spore cortex biosynthesis protein YabQ [Cellulosilyticum ruminicola]|uniref:spore cortex biosynthesis protein YabQ n=1 Tax=Cellulosilyticum ruminicola TaxID=425254 RepID=UPI0006D2111F|nr:spore cortex biosynthesis protein YabQ [Cellulosilyticum ruminicola]